MLNQFGLPVKDYRQGTAEHKRQKHTTLAAFLDRIVHYRRADHRKEKSKSISSNRGSA